MGWQLSQHSVSRKLTPRMRTIYHHIAQVGSLEHSTQCLVSLLIRTVQITI